MRKNNHRLLGILHRTFILALIVVFASGSAIAQKQQHSGRQLKKTVVNKKASPGKENDEYDGPDLAAKLEFEKTKDPATGKVPRIRLLSALDKTMQSRQTGRGG